MLTETKIKERGLGMYSLLNLLKQGFMYLHDRTRYRKNHFEIPDNWTRNAFGFSFEIPTLEVPCSKKQQFQKKFSYSVPYRADFKTWEKLK